MSAGCPRGHAVLSWGQGNFSSWGPQQAAPPAAGGESLSSEEETRVMATVLITHNFLFFY